MAVGNNAVQVQWATAYSKAVTAAGTETSDLISLSATAIGRAITLKADNGGTPASGDTVDFYLLGSCGDPDNTGGDEWPANAAQGEFLGQLNTFGTGNDPSVQTFDISSAIKNAKLFAKSNASSNTITVSSVVNEKVVS